VLHLPPRFLLPHLGVSSYRRQLSIRRPIPLLLDAGDIQGGAGARNGLGNGLQARPSGHPLF
jgi:hypothetical protein